MKTYSAAKLLRLARDKKHVPPCHAQGPSADCICWNNEVQRWDERMKSNAKIRIRKPRKTKIHMSGIKCGAKGTVNTTTTASEVTCQHCNKILTMPVKLSKKTKMTQLNLPATAN